METMRALRSWLVACFFLCAALPAAAQTPVGALAVDERRGEQYGWAVDYETEAAAWEAALSECGAGCSVVLTFARCGAYAADQDADKGTAVGWAESYASADGGSAGGAVGVPFARWRFGLHRASVGLQRAGRRGGVGAFAGDVEVTAAEAAAPDAPAS